ncbi:MAG: hypothetical protein EB092_04995 [Chitinophagia bacterium]|jgi:hypothetical protein|nr:hypothetical protein [Chitinophagia bacterium]NCA30015.1 hypothetical protein [Chitinophagia bacterium]NDD16348.1 hypothetical protein [Chitinophagia bacterium]
MNILVEIIGWIASVLIVGSYALNITGKLAATSKLYVLANIIGGLFFVVNTYYHQAYPSMLVNTIWVIIAIVMLSKKEKK